MAGQEFPPSTRHPRCRSVMQSSWRNPANDLRGQPDELRPLVLPQRVHKADRLFQDQILISARQLLLEQIQQIAMSCHQVRRERRVLHPYDPGFDEVRKLELQVVRRERRGSHCEFRFQSDLHRDIGIPLHNADNFGSRAWCRL